MVTWRSHPRLAGHHVDIENPQDDIGQIKSKIFALRPFLKDDIKFMHIVADNSTQYAAYFANSTFKSLDIFTLHFPVEANGNNDSHNVRTTQKWQAYDQRVDKTEAVRWLNTQQRLGYLDRPTRAAVRRSGRYWTGLSLDTYLATESAMEASTETEILIVGWKSFQEQQRFMDTPNDLGQTW